MNIYLMNEDGDQFCIQAKSMADAVSFCLGSYLEERKHEPDYNEDYERNYYHTEVLQSCSLVGELKNPVYLKGS